MNSFGITDRGKVRRDNQDSFLISRIGGNGCLVAVLCDGMGGERAGNIASDLAAKTFIAQVTEKLSGARIKPAEIASVLSSACSDANNMVYGYSCFDRDYAGMGTTLVAALLDKDKTYVVNVGDSRAYRISNRTITQITKDHSLVQDMVDRGEISALSARVHPRRNVITRALGVDSSVPCDLFTPKLKRGDRLLLCSDGLTNTLMDEEILSIARKNIDPLSLGRALMDAALERGARDNVTVIVITK